MAVATNTNMGYWESIPMTVQLFSDREVWSVGYEGETDTILDFASRWSVGDRYTEENGDNLIVVDVRVNRKPGGLSDCILSYASIYKLEIWNIDFAEVSKDIRTWLVSKYTSSNGTINNEVWPELAKIAQWEHQREVESWITWQNFQYNSKGDVLTGLTKTLAEKMMKGVQTYSIYAPVITRTTTWMYRPEVGGIGKKEKPTQRPGWYTFNNEGGPQSWLALAREYLKVGEKSNSNSDGTFTLVEQWQGADEVDPDLYPSAAAQL